MIELPTVIVARKAVKTKTASRLEAFISTFQPCVPAQARDWRMQLRAILMEFDANHTPWWSHWTEVFGRPGNWRELAPETQQRWIEARYEQVFTECDPARRPLLLIAKNEALASVGRQLPEDRTARP